MYFGRLSYLDQAATRGVVSDARSGSIKFNIIATKIGSIVLLIVTKLYYAKGVCRFQCKRYEQNAFVVPICDLTPIHVDSVCRVCIVFVVFVVVKNYIALDYGWRFLIRFPLGPHILVTIWTFRSPRKQT